MNWFIFNKKTFLLENRMHKLYIDKAASGFKIGHIARKKRQCDHDLLVYHKKLSIYIVYHCTSYVLVHKDRLHNSEKLFVKENTSASCVPHVNEHRNHGVNLSVSHSYKYTSRADVID